MPDHDDIEHIDRSNIPTPLTSIVVCFEAVRAACKATLERHHQLLKPRSQIIGAVEHERAAAHVRARERIRTGLHTMCGSCVREYVFECVVMRVRVLRNRPGAVWCVWKYTRVAFLQEYARMYVCMFARVYYGCLYMNIRC